MERKYDIENALIYIYYNYGNVILSSPQRLKSLLLDLSGDTKEVKILINVISTLGLSDRNTGSNYDFYRIRNSIEEQTGLTEEWSYRIAKYIGLLCGVKLFPDYEQIKKELQYNISDIAVDEVAKHYSKNSYINIKAQTDKLDGNDADKPLSTKRKIKKFFVAIAAVGILCFFIGLLIFFLSKNVSSMNDGNSYSKTTEFNNGQVLAEDEPPMSIFDTTQSYSLTPKIIRAKTLVGTELGASNVDATRTFKAQNVIDGNVETCWCVNTSNDGAKDATIEFDLSERALVKRIAIINGNQFHTYDELYSLNGQVCRFSLTFSDGSKQYFDAAFNNGNPNQYQYFELEIPVITDSIIMTVTSSYVGSKYSTNVSLTEFEVF